VVRIEKRILSPTAVNTYCPAPKVLSPVHQTAVLQALHPPYPWADGHDTLYQFHKEQPPYVRANAYRRSAPTAPYDIQQAVGKGRAPHRHPWDFRSKRSGTFTTTASLCSFHYSDCFISITCPHRSSPRHGFCPKTSCSWASSTPHCLTATVFALVDYKTSKNIEITSDMERQAAFYARSTRTNTRSWPDKVLVHFLKTLESHWSSMWMNSCW